MTACDQTGGDFSRRRAPSLARTRAAPGQVRYHNVIVTPARH
ncbi:MAG TPA: hypothetical protein VMT49_06080 [Steroidobacteraceae bacterium]|nr:hypothetical protein [Steroidobacteraceae bacterium]